MRVEAVARRWSLRAVPWAVWVLLALGVLYAMHGLPPSIPSLSSLAGSGFIFFAAAVYYIAPPDRRFKWAALAIAAGPAANIVGYLILGSWQAFASGDWANALPLLADLRSVANDIATAVGLVGLGLLGLALGGVRSFMSALVLGFGVVVALANVVWVGAHPIDQFPLLELARSVAYATLNVMGWAFVFAAALESLRNLTLIGSGLIFVGVVINAILLWWQPGPGANTDLLSLILSMPSLAGWLLLIAGALRGELSTAAARSRSGRGSGVRRRTG